MPRQSTRQSASPVSGSVQFLSGRQVWAELKQRSAKTKGRIEAAVAYFGKDGATLLTLKAGDTLLVDMSLRAVRQGVTDPREVKKLIRRGVEVFSREELHAKFYIIEGSLICGSANVSTRSSMALDEAAIVTHDPSVVRRARAYLNSMCSEPVSDLYLEQCIKEYQPPWFTAARGGQIGKRGDQCAKVWFVSGLTFRIALPEADQLAISELEKEASNEITAERHTVSWIRFSRKPRYFDSIQKHNWVVGCVREGKRRSVGCPSQVLSKRTYKTSRGTVFHMLMLSVPNGAQSMTFSEFRKRVVDIAPELGGTRPRTRAIGDRASGDALLRLWTQTGRLRGGRRP
jgi:hypothetical protein